MKQGVSPTSENKMEENSNMIKKTFALKFHDWAKAYPHIDKTYTHKMKKAFREPSWA